jgi:hypothetical protein
MNKEAIDRELRAANPLAPRRLASLDLDAAEAALGTALFTESAHASESEGADLESRRQSQRPRSILLALAAATAVVAAAAILLLAGGAESPTRAYGAKLVRFAEATPLLLLEAPGWRVRNANELKSGEGTMEFVTGKPVPHQPTAVSADDTEPGMAPPPVRQRRVELAWYNAKLSKLLKLSFNDWVPGRKFTTAMPALGTMVYVDTTAGSSRDRGGPGDREMVAIWREGSHVLELRASVPDLAAFRERLGWLHRVDAQTWFDAMPAKVKTG